MRTLIHWRALLGLLAVLALPAQAASQDPHKLVQETTEQVIQVINQGKSYFDSDPDRFYREVQAVLDPVIDFDGFARGVMGSYASAQRYNALKTEQEKTAFRQQVRRFTDNFRRGVVQTYAKGLLQFSGQRIETVPPRGGASGSSVSITQNIHGAADKPYVVQYTLRQDRSGAWKVRNVIIEGINLGQTYRNQFAASAEANRGDIDKVIDTWQVAPKGLEGDGARQ